ncbi:MAG: hypothetical protein MZU79_07600 [Anaerotruncus sp.]|nr:hypothetical protein [Anaerotruncus sp.]
MAERVENLTLESAIKIQEDYSPRLHRILRGERITPAHDDWLKTRFDLHEYRIITDFNRAARYVRGLSGGQAGLPPAHACPARSRAPSTCRSRRAGTTRS